MIEIPIYVRSHHVASFRSSEEFLKDLAAIVYNLEKPVILIPTIGHKTELTAFSLEHFPSVPRVGTSTERTDFEKWAKTKGMNLNTRSDGQYSEYRTGVSWDAWCAKL